MLGSLLILVVAAWACRVYWVRLHHDDFRSEINAEQRRLRKLGRAAGWQ